MECTDIFNFRYVTNKIVLICIFFCENPQSNLFWILRVSAVGLANWSEFFGYFIEASSDM